MVQLVSIELRRLSSGLGRWSRWWRMPGWLVRVGRGSERELDARRRAGSNGSRRWRSQRAATAAAEVQQPDVRTPPPNRRVDAAAGAGAGERGASGLKGEGERRWSEMPSGGCSAKMPSEVGGIASRLVRGDR